MPPKKKAAPKRASAKRAPAKKNIARPKKVPTPESISTVDMIPLLVYRRIAITFAVLVAAALLIVIYLSTMQAVIRVRPVQVTLSTDFIVTATAVPLSDTEVKGVILSGTLGKTETFESTGDGEVEVEDFSEGLITITNNMPRSQPLVVRTRFLSAEGVLFRLTEGTVVPAGETVEVVVRADVKGSSGDIGPAKFSIPGLSVAKQENVYGESFTAFRGGSIMLAVVSESELEQAANALRDNLVFDAKSMLRQEAGDDLAGESFEVTVNEKTYSIEPNTQADSYDITMSVSVTGVFFDQEALEVIAVRKLYEGLGQGKEFISIGNDEMDVIVDKYNQEDGVASLLVSLDGQAITAQTSEALDVSQFVGLNEYEVEQKLIGEGVATAVDVEFFPFWVMSVPRLQDHIFIEIQ